MSENSVLEQISDRPFVKSAYIGSGHFWAASVLFGALARKNYIGACDRPSELCKNFILPFISSLSAWGKRIPCKRITDFGNSITSILSLRVRFFEIYFPVAFYINFKRTAIGVFE